MATYDFVQGLNVATLFLKTKTDGYTYDGTTLTHITDVDYPAATTRGAVYLDGKFFVCTPAGNVYQSATEDALSWAALEFIGARKEPDQAVFITKYRDYIMVLKEWSCEFFYDAANATGSILAPVGNMFSLIGCADENSVRELAGTIFWLGTTKDGYGRSIYRMSDSSPQVVSTPQVDKLLDDDDLSSISSWVAKLGSHTFYGINLTSLSLAYDLSTGLWSVFTYLNASGVTKTISAISTVGVVTSTAHGYSDGDIIKVSSTNGDWDGWHVVTAVSTDSYVIQGTGAVFAGSGSSEKYTEGPFPIKHSTSCGGRQVMQADNLLYEFSPDFRTDEVGAIASRVRTVKFDSGNTKRKSVAAAELVGDKVESTALMRYSDDDFQTFSDFRPVDLVANRSRIRRLGNTNRRAFEILHVGDAAIRLEALELDIGQEGS